MRTLCEAGRSGGAPLSTSLGSFPALRPRACLNIGDVSSGQKDLRLGMLTCFKQALIFQRLHRFRENMDIFRRFRGLKHSRPVVLHIISGEGDMDRYDMLWLQLLKQESPMRSKVTQGKFMTAKSTALPPHMAFSRSFASAAQSPGVRKRTPSIVMQ